MTSCQLLGVCAVMIPKEQALSQVERWLSTRPRASCGSPWVIYDTLEAEEFWLFCWTSRRARHRGIGMVGNYPIAVTKDNGDMYVWLILAPFAEFVDRFHADRTSLPKLE